MESFSFLIPESRIIERLQFENPWWRDNAIEENYHRLPRRLYFNLLKPFLRNKNLRRAIILLGPRRVGKTVMMHHAIQYLMDSGIKGNQIIFVGIDNPIFINTSLEQLYLHALKASGNDSKEHYVFFDEIQYLKNWEQHLKVLVDSYPATRFIVSGSAAAALKVGNTESGAGRFTEFLLPPLTFQEFLHLQNLQSLVQSHQQPVVDEDPTVYYTNDIKELNEQFFQYLNYGGYPEVIFSDAVKSNMQKFIKNDILDKVLLRDLPGLHGIRDVQELNRFFAYLAYNTGKEFSPERISRESQLDKNTIKSYLDYLEAAFLIKVIHKTDDHAKSFKRITGYKIYLTNPSLRTALFAPVDPIDDDAGPLVETGIFAQFFHVNTLQLHYASWQNGKSRGEVDMVFIDSIKRMPHWACEIKWSNRAVQKPSELKSLMNYCTKNNLQKAIVTSIDKTEKVMYDGVEINFRPAAIHAYTIAANTLTQGY
jgi:uncharacterized protein